VPGSARLLILLGSRSCSAVVTTPGRRARTHDPGFWAIAFSLLVVTAFSTAPSPLYGLYSRYEHLSPLTLTIVYAVYAAGVTVSLLLAGHVSDWYGRRVVLIPALVLAMVGAVLFISWKSLAGLLLARVLTGSRWAPRSRPPPPPSPISRPGETAP
jgi:MFS family permease